MDDDVPLFAGFEPPPPAPGRPELSAGRRLTLRQAEEIKAGRHPLMRGPLHPEADRFAHRDDGPSLPFRCGTCVHRTTGPGWPKCAIGPKSRAVTTDVRAWWPACPSYEPTQEI